MFAMSVIQRWLRYISIQFLFETCLERHKVEPDWRADRLIHAGPLQDCKFWGGGRSEYSYIRVLPDEFSNRVQINQFERKTVPPKRNIKSLMTKRESVKYLTEVFSNTPKQNKKPMVDNKVEWTIPL